jgi:hypothetical protein
MSSPCVAVTVASFGSEGLRLECTLTVRLQALASVFENTADGGFGHAGLP